MGIEIERRFLMKSQAWWNTPGTRYRDIKQGYLSIQPDATVRVRLESYVEDRMPVRNGYITVKGRSVGATRSEHEFPIPAKDAEELINGLCQHALEKRRWYLPHGGHTWHIDVFEGNNRGLAIAEIELASEDEQWERPDWLSTEITEDHRYANANLAVNPWRFW